MSYDFVKEFKKHWGRLYVRAVNKWWNEHFTPEEQAFLEGL